MDALREITSRWFGLFALCVALSLPAGLNAQESDDVQLPAQSDVRIIVDISGSMKDTDPENLRQPAVRLLARLLPEGATAGVWTFGQYVNMLVPHREVTDEWRDMAIQRSAQINSVALRTNLGAAIETASDDYFTDGDLSRTHFILLTDGKVDISEDPAANTAEENRILDTIVADLIERGATFHPVALSEAADTDFLKALATESGGRFQVADTADALNLAFLQALNTAVPQEQIPIEGNGFTVDEGVREFTALIFWGESETSATRELSVVRPDEQVVNLSQFPNNVRWAREAGYDLITVNEPLAGQWRINGELGEGSRVTVVSDLRMVVNPLPPTFTSEEPLNIRVGFFEEQEKITNPDFLGVIEVSLSITSEDGRSGTKVLSGEQPPEDGTYRDAVSGLPAAGLYTFDVVADGQTFSRKFSATVGFTVPEGTEPVVQPAESLEPEVTEPEPAPEQSEPESPVSEPVQSEPEPAIASPIDVSQAEEPAPVTEEPEEASTASAMPLWMYGAAGGGLVVIGGLVWFALRQRKQRQQEQADAAAERETLEDLQEEPEPEPVAELEETTEPDAEASLEPNDSLEPDDSLELDESDEVEEIPEVTEEAPEDDMSELEAVIDEHEATLKAEDEALAEPEVESAEESEEDIPVADTPVEEEPEDIDEEIPELEDVADPSDADALEDDDEEEFGLEDFDLSEFDDLPDYDQGESGLPEDDPKKKPDQKDQKK
ncbi:VWA domain-containing protein [Marinobacter sp. BW6]|uniref:VWA domain-containing protein n=1 Tax=Marinobacter sp. BW6 TaxID=2592624 RepID=UPI0011DEE461|nr:VWA domain-containing protein [Marinobacter sp. BW6]TYC62693.1 VWA domain-containing protein [Marinobacter sp. BW6]